MGVMKREVLDFLCGTAVGGSPCRSQECFFRTERRDSNSDLHACTPRHPARGRKGAHQPGARPRGSGSAECGLQRQRMSIIHPQKDMKYRYVLAMRRVDLEDIRHSRISQIQENKHCMRFLE